MAGSPPPIRMPFRQRYVSAAERTYFGRDGVQEAFQGCFDNLERRYPGRWTVQSTHVAVDYSRDDERVLVVVNGLIRYDDDEPDDDEP